ncbi:P22 phage major capsid protein family protein [Glutamicibacter mysorens]
MAYANAIPEVWSSKILQQFEQQAIFAGLANKEYEGEAQVGNVVHIVGINPIVIKDYKAAGRTTSADNVTDTGIDLPIDIEKSFDFQIDDIDEAQAKPKLLNAYTKSAAFGLTEDVDKTLAAILIAQGTAVTPAAPATDAKTAWNVVRDLKKAMAKAKVPTSERVLVFNAEFAALLDENDAKLMKADESGTTAGLRDASYGKLLGFSTYESENLPTTNAPQIVGWHRSALVFASQIRKTEAMRAQNSFADRLRGLHVYGAKNLRPDAVFHYTGTVTP